MRSDYNANRSSDTLRYSHLKMISWLPMRLQCWRHHQEQDPPGWERPSWRSLLDAMGRSQMGTGIWSPEPHQESQTTRRLQTANSGFLLFVAKIIQMQLYLSPMSVDQFNLTHLGARRYRQTLQIRSSAALQQLTHPRRFPGRQISCGRWPPQTLCCQRMCL
jgi:hypothetical protein